MSRAGSPATPPTSGSRIIPRPVSSLSSPNTSSTAEPTTAEPSTHTTGSWPSLHTKRSSEPHGWSGRLHRRVDRPKPAHLPSVRSQLRKSPRRASRLADRGPHRDNGKATGRGTRRDADRAPMALARPPRSPRAPSHATEVDVGIVYTLAE